MFYRLEPEDRLRLLRFVCSFAWADLEIAPEERDFVARIVEQLNLDDAEKKLVGSWLQQPPAPEDVDPTDVPREHRELFITAAEKTILADHRVTEEEAESLTLFKRLLE